MNTKYEELSNNILDLIGGKSNVTFFTHCVTRLRFNVKDRSLVKKEEIEDIEGVLGTQWQNEQFQIIIGQSVGDAYNLISHKTGLGTQSELSENNVDLEGLPKKFEIGAIFNAITACITPLIPLLIGGGMVKVLALVLEISGILTTDNSTHMVLSFVGDSVFYFLPIFVGATAARRFGANMGLGMLIGAMFIHPAFISAVTAGTPLNFLNIPIYPAFYASTIFPAILSVWLMTPIQKFFGKISPEYIRAITEPLLTILVMIPIALCLTGPVGAFLGNYLSATIIWIYDVTGFLGVGVLAAIMPFVIMTGMHSSLFPYTINSLATLGLEPIVGTSMAISGMTQAAACLGVALKSKSKRVKSVSIGAFTTALFGGVTEPAMYGVTLKYKTPMYASMIGSLVGGCVAGFGKAAMYALPGAGGVAIFPVYMPGGLANVLWLVAGVVVAMILTCIITYVSYSDAE
ncbi:PTS transporter subunit EIIC [Carnobacteriaceae bacterium zg-ZUI252]|nr:PTS transporter subunit EIIC [Carnobacteriaceae bacterium zg-ZUI252]MBS4770056.1 PTS transporter subunit EIIC [Carnobacteriaceae bacterium zg-ZUI240]